MNPVTLLEQAEKGKMKYNVASWPSLLRDGGWEQKAGGGYFPEYILRTHKDVLRVVHIASDKSRNTTWRLFINGKSTMSGELDECLELGNSIASCAHLDLLLG